VAVAEALFEHAHGARAKAVPVILPAYPIRMSAARMAQLLVCRPWSFRVGKSHLKDTALRDLTQGVKHPGRPDSGDRVLTSLRSGRCPFQARCKTFFEVLSFQLSALFACHSGAMTLNVSAA
jgi:hypothetical protein